VLEEDVHQLPEDVVAGLVDLLHDEGVAIVAGEQPVGLPGPGMRAGTGEGDRLHAPRGRLLDPGRHRRLGRVVGRQGQPDGDVVRLAEFSERDFLQDCLPDFV